MLCSAGRIHDNGRWGRFTTLFAFSKVLGGVYLLLDVNFFVVHMSGACAITNKTVDGVDPYSETAMEELEKLGFDEEEEDITEDKNGASEIELFISEGNDTKMALDKNRTTNKLISNKSYTPPSTLEKAKGVVKRPQRPLSCILPAEQSIIEESMKRNSLDLHMSDGEEIGL
jgi:hypothetical protein